VKCRFLFEHNCHLLFEKIFVHLLFVNLEQTSRYANVPHDSSSSLQKFYCALIEQYPNTFQVICDIQMTLHYDAIALCCESWRFCQIQSRASHRGYTISIWRICSQTYNFLFILYRNEQLLYVFKQLTMNLWPLRSYSIELWLCTVSLIRFRLVSTLSHKLKSKKFSSVNAIFSWEIVCNMQAFILFHLNIIVYIDHLKNYQKLC